MIELDSRLKNTRLAKSIRKSPIDGAKSNEKLPHNRSQIIPRAIVVEVKARERHPQTYTYLPYLTDNFILLKLNTYNILFLNRSSNERIFPLPTLSDRSPLPHSRSRSKSAFLSGGFT